MFQPSERSTSIARQLLALRKQDIGLRQKISRLPRDQRQRAAQRLLSQNDRRISVQLLAILRVHGWPTNESVGLEAARAAWLLVMHAEPWLLPFALGAVRRLPPGYMDPIGLAYLEDRYRVLSGRPQIYGTQWKVAIDRMGRRRWHPHPILNPRRCRSLRASLGLGSIRTGRPSVSA